MNILPKKRWHVRTKDNIARVRRDEAKAAAEEKELQRRIKLAEQEARMTFLRSKATEKLTPEQKQALQNLTDKDATLAPSTSKSSTTFDHVNFFAELEGGDELAKTNAEHEAEKKKEQEEYEKKIGLLTYLGQDTNELTGEQSWWQKIPQKRGYQGSDSEPEISDKKLKNDKLKDSLDPLKDVRSYLGTPGVSSIVKKSSKSTSKDHEKREIGKSPAKKSKKKKHKKDKKSKKSKKSRRKDTSESESESENEDSKAQEKFEKQQKLEKLRLERIKREEKERQRAHHLLYGTPLTSDKNEKSHTKSQEDHRKYNTQFNPHLAKQNKLDANQKYWLS